MTRILITAFKLSVAKHNTIKNKESKQIALYDENT